MKKFLVIALMFIGMITNAQEVGNFYNSNARKYAFVSTGFDVRNAIVGSKPTDNKSALDVNVKVGALYNHLEIAMFYENFHRITFQAYGINVNYVGKVAKNTDVVVGIEAGSIIRQSNSNFLMCGGNAEVRYQLGVDSKFSIGLQYNARLRTDIWYKDTPMPIVHSGLLNVYYRLR